MKKYSRAARVNASATIIMKQNDRWLAGCEYASGAHEIELNKKSFDFGEHCNCTNGVLCSVKIELKLFSFRSKIKIIVQFTCLCIGPNNRATDGHSDNEKKSAEKTGINRGIMYAYVVYACVVYGIVHRHVLNSEPQSVHRAIT